MTAKAATSVLPIPNPILRRRWLKVAGGQAGGLRDRVPLHLLLVANQCGVWRVASLSTPEAERPRVAQSIHSVDMQVALDQLTAFGRDEDLPDVPRLLGLRHF